MDGLWKTLLKWMIWGYHYFRKHPYGNIWYKSHWVSGPCLISGFCSTFLHSFGRLGIEKWHWGSFLPSLAGQGDQTKGIGPSLNIHHFYRFTQLLYCWRWRFLGFCRFLVWIGVVSTCSTSNSCGAGVDAWKSASHTMFKAMQRNDRKITPNKTFKNRRYLKMYHPTDVNERW